MKKLLTLSLVISLIAAGNALASKVTGINISHADGFTVAQIDVDGEVRFTHQTEIAKDGKPFRIIVDVLAATHEMGAKIFNGLPDCRITGIRTSQYSVEPENTVRLVFDMKGETAYRIDAKQNSLRVFVSDPDAVQFPAWSSYNVYSGQSMTSIGETVNAESTPNVTADDDAAASIIATINQSLAEDRLSSLEPAPAQSTTGSDSENNYDNSDGKTAAEILEEINRETALALESLKPLEPASSASTTENKIATESNQSPTPTTTASPLFDEPTRATETPETTAITRPIPTEPVRLDEGNKGTDENLQKSLLPKTPNKTEPAKLAESGVETGTIVESPNQESPTARFRRDPSKSKRIRGTMVAEFPTRLVIKYKGRNYRDPFETLINETKTHNNPMEIRVPNVEGLRLVGIIESYGDGNSALFEDKDGYGYILRAGDKVQKGYVLRVDNDRVYFQIFEYGWSRTVALDMEIF